MEKQSINLSLMESMFGPKNILGSGNPRHRQLPRQQDHERSVYLGFNKNIPISENEVGDFFQKVYTSTSSHSVKQNVIWISIKYLIYLSITNIVSNFDWRFGVIEAYFQKSHGYVILVFRNSSSVSQEPNPLRDTVSPNDLNSTANDFLDDIMLQLLEKGLHTSALPHNIPRN